MINLSTDFSENEKKVLIECAGKEFEVLSSVEGESYILCEKGDYYYNQCFHPTNIEFYAKQKYEKIIPHRLIKFYQYYLMNMEEDKNIWYRGRKDISGNWEYECYSDSLEEAFESI